MIKGAIYELNEKKKDQTVIGYAKIQLVERRFTDIRVKEIRPSEEKRNRHPTSLNAFFNYEWVVKSLPDGDSTNDRELGLEETTTDFFLISETELYEDLNFSYEYVGTET